MGIRHDIGRGYLLIKNSRKITLSGGGYLNFRINKGEIWDIFARIDPLVDFFLNKMEEVDLVNVESSKIVPTWRN